MTTTATPVSATPTAPRLPNETRRSAPTSWASVTAGAVFILLGGAWLLDVLNVAELRAAQVLPVLLAVVGIVLIGASFYGDHSGLVTLGTVLTVASVFSALVPSEALRGGVGEREFVVSTDADLKPDYELAAGDLAIDFSDLTLSDTRDVEVVVGAGNLNLILPDDVEVDVTVETGVGEIRLLDEHVDGLALDQQYRSPGYDDADARLNLKIEVGVGSTEVTK